MKSRKDRKKRNQLTTETAEYKGKERGEQVCTRLAFSFLPFSFVFFSFLPIPLLSQALFSVCSFFLCLLACLFALLVPDSLVFLPFSHFSIHFICDAVVALLSLLMPSCLRCFPSSLFISLVCPSRIVFLFCFLLPSPIPNMQRSQKREFRFHLLFLLSSMISLFACLFVCCLSFTAWMR